MKNLVFKDYKDKHKNERVFILGNGPSLNETDLNLLEKENTIAMNRISMIYDKYKYWRPTYYFFCSTEIKHKKYGAVWLSSVLSSIFEPSTTSFIASMFKENIDPNNNLKNIKWFHVLSETKPDDTGEIKEDSFSTNILDRIDKSGSTINDPNHFYNNNYEVVTSNQYRANQKLRNVHKLALSVFNKNKPNVKIYNASVRTVLDTYPIIKFYDYINNHKIVERPEDLEKAKLFWKNQIYIEPKPDTLIIKIFNKIKKILKLILK